MKTKHKLALLVFLALFHLDVQSDEAGYKALFHNTKSKLTDQEKSQIFDRLGFKYNNGTFSDDSGTCEGFYADAEALDLNKDGIEEVLVNWGDTCTSGLTANTITLFIKSPLFGYMKNIDAPGSYEALKTKNKKFPDILVGGAGFCHGVWRWNGDEYAYKCSKQEEPGACTDIAPENICR